MLQARAMENMAYVCGVNRVGIDGKGFVYRGDSMIFSPKGKKLADAGKREEVTRTCTLTRADLEDLRGKFLHGRTRIRLRSSDISLIGFWI